MGFTDQQNQKEAELCFLLIFDQENVLTKCLSKINRTPGIKGLYLLSSEGVVENLNVIDLAGEKLRTTSGSTDSEMIGVIDRS